MALRVSMLMAMIRDLSWPPREIPTGRREDNTPFFTRGRLVALVALLALALLALFYLWQSWQYVYWLNELHRARAELEELQAEHERLKFEVGRAFSLERIERIATEELHMIRPSPRYLVLPPLEP